MEIFEITDSNRKKVGAIFEKYKHFLDDITEQRETHFFVRHFLNTGEILFIEFNEYKYHTIAISGKFESSLLRNREYKFTEFDFKINYEIVNNKLSFHISQHAKNPFAKSWLISPPNDHSHSSVTHILFADYVAGSFALSLLKSLLKKTERNDTITYSITNDFTEQADSYLNYLIMKTRKEHLLDGWDIVNLTEKQYDKVIELNQQRNVEYDVDNIPLPKFCLSIFDGKETDYYFFEKRGKIIECGVTDPQNFVTKHFAISLDGVTAEGVKSTLCPDLDAKELWTWLNASVEGSNGDAGANWEWCADAFFIINTFMLHYADVSMEVEEKIALAPSDPSRRAQKKQERNTSRLFKCYTLKKNWVANVARKKAEITCPAWGVRGHFRHYKNGKVVFVESYIKGKEKDKYKGKEYALMPYSEA